LPWLVGFDIEPRGDTDRKRGVTQQGERVERGEGIKRQELKVTRRFRRASQVGNVKRGGLASSCSAAPTGPTRARAGLGGQHQGTANQSAYQGLRLMHKTSIRVVDGNELET
jgi:hypothetical protein